MFSRSWNLLLTNDQIASSNLLEYLRSVTKHDAMEVSLWSHAGKILPACSLSICNSFVDFLDLVLDSLGFGWEIVKGGNLMMLGLDRG